MRYLGRLAGTRRTSGGNQLEYDALDHLTQAQKDGTYGGYTQTFAYNSLGNLTTMAGTSQWYSDTAHVHAVTHVGGTRKFWYDANGNEITRTVGAVTFVQTWDAENRLATISAGGVVTTYTYNGDGARVKVACSGSATVYVGSTYEVITSTGAATSYYFLGSQRVAMRTASGVTWLAGDHLGSTSLSMNSGGARVSEERYYPYGATRAVTGTMATDYQFTGQKNDGGTGLYYYNARYYDPVTGRFVSADTIVPNLGKPQALNRYSYVYNNPVKYTDPTGHTVGCGAGDDTCGYSDPPTDYDPAGRRSVIFELGKRLQDIQTSDGLDPLVSFAALTHVAADLNRSNPVSSFVSDLTCVINGYCSGPDWGVPVLPSLKLSLQKSPFLGQDAFGGKGSWSTRLYDETPNQMYHFWFYVAIAFSDNTLLSLVGNIIHDPVARNPFYPGFGPPQFGNESPKDGITLADNELGIEGASLGYLLSWGRVSPYQVPQWIRSGLSR